MVILILILFRFFKVDNLWLANLPSEDKVCVQDFVRAYDGLDRDATLKVR